MIFSSNIFLFTFLPIFLLVYYLTPARYKNGVVLTASYVFYAWWRVDFLLLFVVVTLFNYKIGLNIDSLKKSDHNCSAKKWLTAGVIGNLATLGYFKYMSFGVQSFNTLLNLAGINPVSSVSIVLPIGISFYIFQSISYIVDVYRGDAPATRRLIDFAAFVALFPQLIAGPVLRYKDLADQFVSRTHTWSKFGEGATWFMVGFVKKVFVADSIAPLVEDIFSKTDVSFAESWLGAVTYSLQLFFDFSGYSDMAIGLGLMIGFRFVNNFNHPYISQSISEFWRRWHISLSSWLRDYLYIPLGGNRSGGIQNYRNLFLTMFLGGIWHGANWTFILWGAWHGLWLVIEKRFNLVRREGFSVFAWAMTLLIIMVGWVMFRAASVHDAFRIYNAMAGLTDATTTIDLTASQLAVILTAMLSIGLSPVLSAWSRRGQSQILKLASYSLVPLFALSVLKLSAQSYSPFLYFQF